MRASEMLDAKAEFWEVVRDCLNDFHPANLDVNQEKLAKLRESVDQMPVGQAEFFYHSEPFDIACEIADNPLPLEIYLDRYLQIRDFKHGDGICLKATSQWQTSGRK